MIKFHRTKFGKEDGSKWKASWLQINLFRKAFTFFKKFEQV